MSQVNPLCFHLSASSISSFKACPTRFRLSYREGLRLAEDTDSQRMGTNWHKMHETYAEAIQLAQMSTGITLLPQEHALEVVVAHLNEVYKKAPAYKTITEWELEREILLVSFVGYLWQWQDDPIEVLASEVPFDLPIHNHLGLPLPISEVKRVGKIDHVIKWQGAVCALERKSTSRAIDPDSDYWDKSKKDTQVSMYALAFRDMAWNNVPGVIKDALNAQVIDTQTVRFGNTLYDVWHKPTISPKMLTQADTKVFIETGDYMGQKFSVQERFPNPDPAQVSINVDGTWAEIEMGKKGFAIRETVKMFGARLLSDIYERPDFYYARREIVRTDAELQKFRGELYAIYQTQKAMDKTGNWYENESQCRATFPCPYIPICYGPGADAVCDGKTTPVGFKRIFVDLTVNGSPVSED